MDLANGYRIAVEKVQMQSQAIQDPRTDQALQLIEKGDYRNALELIGQLDPRLQLPLYEAYSFHVTAAFYEVVAKTSTRRRQRT